MEKNQSYIFIVPNWVLAVRIILAWLYRALVAGGAIALVWNGLTPWVLFAVLPILVLGPRSR
jgi:hypothetical protein